MGQMSSECVDSPRFMHTSSDASTEDKDLFDDVMHGFGEPSMTGNEDPLRKRGGVALPPWFLPLPSHKASSAEAALHLYRHGFLTGSPDCETHLRAYRELLESGSSSALQALVANFDTSNIILARIGAYDIKTSLLQQPPLSQQHHGEPGEEDWRIVRLVCDHVERTRVGLSWLHEKCRSILFLACLWAPVSVVASLMNVFAQFLSLDIIVQELRFLSLAHGFDSVNETVTRIIARCDELLKPSTKSLLLDIHQALVDEKDLVDGECGGNNKDLILERLRFQARVLRLRLAMEATWNCEPCVVPSFLPVFTKEEQAVRVKRCRVLKQICSLPTTPKAEIVSANREIASLMLGTELRFFSEIMDRVMLEATRSFMAQAKTFDSHFNADDMFQASRNAWTCYALQLLFSPGTAGLNDGIFGYSMLYPYSDNYLDDPSISSANKRAFQAKFRRWLGGYHSPAPSTDNERKIHSLICTIENLYSHDKDPNAFNALVSILDGQTASLGQHVSAGQPPPSLEVLLDISTHKGGTSVLADMLMVDSHASREGELFSFQFGFVLQLIDDLQDVLGDHKHGQHTMFTLGLERAEAMDPYALRIMHLLESTLHPSLQPYLVEDSDIRYLREQMLLMCYSIVLKSVIKSKHLFTPVFVSRCESFAPLPMSSLAKVNSMRHLLDLVKKDLI